jgi:YcaO-like protein with predicted kinase domain
MRKPSVVATGGMIDREHVREELAREICALPYSRLMEYGLTRASDITGLDTIGLPVYTVSRPGGEVITVSAGKGLSKIAAKAGAILEGVELWAGEKPHANVPWFYLEPARAISVFPSVLGTDLFPLARGAPVYSSTPIPWEIVTDVFREGEILVPSDMIWLTHRVIPPFHYFQSSSNGLAAGINYEDALLQAVYELVERDGWATSEYLREQTDIWPDRVSFDCPLTEEIEFCLEALARAGVYPFLFDLSNDMQVPVFGCTVIDPSSRSPGIFSGYGCSLNSSTAMRRAITEACQARVAYIGSARDDLFRRRFMLTKNIDSRQLLEMYQAVPLSRLASEFPRPEFDSITEEWEILSNRIRQRGVSECYSKILYESKEPAFTIVRAISPSLCSPIWEFWQPDERCKLHVHNKLASIKEHA